MLTRRRLLQGIGCSIAASPFVTPVSMAAVPSDNRLVVVILRGAMDGLDVLQPYGDPDLARLRPGWGIGPAAGALDLTGFHAMHPALADLKPLWDAGDLAFAQAVSTPYRGKRSHFDGQDILEAGTPGLGPERGRDGWLNRLLAGIPGATGTTAFAVGRQDMLVLRGDAAHSSWSPDAQLDLAPATQSLLTHIYQGDALFADAAAGALALSQDGAMEMEGGRKGQQNAVFDFTAEQLRGETRIAALSIGGWDTHRAQERQIAGPLDTLQRGILRLRDGLGADWDRTTVLAMTEFGRTAAINGTKGTDHGTGGVMVMAGGAVRGGKVYGDWPGLAEAALFERRDLMPTRDVRAYAAWVLAGQFGIGRTLLEQVVFPGLDMGADPRLLR
jgi:uncharacterized protein (DUF1501 family)